jgi:hypothetical protein
MEEMRSCKTDDVAVESEKNPSACNVFVARAVNYLFGIDDFGPDPVVGHFMRSNEIAVAVRQLSQWKLVGTADDPRSLKRACELANARLPAIAIWRNRNSDQPGHVVVLIPGECSRTSWGNDVPNSASYFLSKPVELAYAGKPLSQAFGKSIRQEVELWWREHTEQ